MSYAHGFHNTKRTHIIIHGTCLSGLYPAPFTHNFHDYLHFNIYIPFGGPKYRINALNSMRNGPSIQISTTHFMYTSCNYYQIISTKIT
ncbi:BCE_3a_G0024060.mRNA.1.CDS.1 [Saccharomyces cerevisiae]|nr:BCE_3a_G0024060.mRNA.1.CDS.1 [Saccharomyces cerevisiae]CAI7129412.1 BCE_3a_G0024060.mRNA.1.CDS.1 [Saccharomyces cerevisiae]